MNWVNATRPSAVAGKIADYGEFLETKQLTVQSDGVDVEPEQLCPALFPFQRDLTRWALRKGRSAVFADTGLGKTLIQLAWAEHAADRTLILAPLAVAQQTVLEGARWGISVTYARSKSQAAQRGITITNYEMLDHFHASAFGAVVLDESSCLKAYDGKTRTKLIRAFANTPMRLCCTATPAPNDIAEIANHAEFLGILTRAEMLATFFVHDENGWRLKGHAREPFYRWLASWGMSLKKPSDLGYADDGYDLPPLTITPIIVPTEWAPPGQMFPTTLKGITERSAVRKDTLAARVEAAVRLIRAEESGYNFGDESRARNGQGDGETRVPEALACREQGAVASLPRSHEREAQCAASGALRRERGAQGGGEGEGSELVGRTSGSEENAATEEARDISGDLQGSVGTPRGAVCDMPLLRHERSELFPAGGSLPQNGGGQRAALHELQPSTGEVHGRSAAAECGDRLPAEQWLLWCGLNGEQDALAAAFSAECVSIDGRTPNDEKIRLLDLWLTGKRRILISKPKVFGFGLNLQRCARMAFVGLSDSYEAYYQAIRRCWRYGQTRSVHAYIVLTEPEEPVYQNVLRKEREAETMAAELLKHVRVFEQAEIAEAHQRIDYAPLRRMEVPSWVA